MDITIQNSSYQQNMHNITISRGLVKTDANRNYLHNSIIGRGEYIDSIVADDVFRSIVLDASWPGPACTSQTRTE